MAGTKLLRGNVSIYAFFKEAVDDWSNLSGAELQAAVDAGLGFDISCAISDDSLTANMTDSDTDDSMSICDVGNVETPTFFNYEVSFDTFRNGPASAGASVPVYELPVQLFSAPDRPFYIVKRIGVPQGTPLAAGQTISAYGVNTDYPTDILGDGENIMFGSRFKADGQLNTNVDLA